MGETGSEYLLGLTQLLWPLSHRASWVVPRRSVADAQDNLTLVI